MTIDNRTMPESVAGEAAVLGSMLIDPQTIPQVLEIIGERPEAFYQPKNRMIFEAILHLYEKMHYPLAPYANPPVKSKITLQALVEELESKNQLEFIGGVNYIAQLTRCAKPKNELPGLIKIIKGKKKDK